MEMDIDEYRLIVRYTDLQPQQVEQVHYWSTRHLNRPDACRACGLVLTGSLGPTCPRCRKPVRVLESVNCASDA